MEYSINKAYFMFIVKNGSLERAPDYGKKDPCSIHLEGDIRIAWIFMAKPTEEIAIRFVKVNVMLQFLYTRNHPDFCSKKFKQEMQKFIGDKEEEAKFFQSER